MMSDTRRHLDSYVETSESRPITISWIIRGHPEGHPTSCSGSDAQAVTFGGKLGLCFCPGKQHMRGGKHLVRSLDLDLVRLKERYGIQCVVCLLNDAELRSYSIRGYESVLRRHGLEYMQHPIIECAAPDHFEPTADFVEALAARLRQGQTLAVHCRGGVGRAGMIAACVLLNLGLAKSSTEAIKEVRRLRCKTAVETRKQEDFVSDPFYLDSAFKWLAAWVGTPTLAAILALLMYPRAAASKQTKSADVPAAPYEMTSQSRFKPMSGEAHQRQEVGGRRNRSSSGGGGGNGSAGGGAGGGLPRVLGRLMRRFTLGRSSEGGRQDSSYEVPWSTRSTGGRSSRASSECSSVRGGGGGGSLARQRSGGLSRRWQPNMARISSGQDLTDMGSRAASVSSASVRPTKGFRASSSHQKDSLPVEDSFVYNGNLAVDCLPYDTTDPAMSEVRDVVHDTHLLQFGMLIGESSAELAIGQQRAAHPTGPTDASLYGAVGPQELQHGRGWERLVEEHKPGLHYWVCRKHLRKGLYMYKSRTVYERATAAQMVAFTFADNTIRRGWDDSSMAMQPIAPPSKQDMSPEALEAAANCQSSFMYSRTRFPPPMAHREYVFARRVWYKADDGGCYCISKACLHPAPPQPGCRTVRVEDYSAGFVIRAVPGIYFQEGAVEVVSNYFEDSRCNSGIINMGIRKALWPMTQKSEAGFRKYVIAHAASGLPARRIPPFEQRAPIPLPLTSDALYTGKRQSDSGNSGSSSTSSSSAPLVDLLISVAVSKVTLAPASIDNTSSALIAPQTDGGDSLGDARQQVSETITGCSPFQDTSAVDLVTRMGRSLPPPQTPAAGFASTSSSEPCIFPYGEGLSQVSTLPSLEGTLMSLPAADIEAMTRADTSLCNQSMFSGYMPALTHRLHITPILYATYLAVWRVGASVPVILSRAFHSASSVLLGLTSLTRKDMNSLSPASMHVACVKLLSHLIRWLSNAARGTGVSVGSGSLHGEVKHTTPQRTLASFPLNSKSSGDLFGFLDADDETSSASAEEPPARGDGSGPHDGPCGLHGSGEEDDCSSSSSSSGSSVGGEHRKLRRSASSGGGFLKRVLKVAAASGLPLMHAWLSTRTISMQQREHGSEGGGPGGKVSSKPVPRSPETQPSIPQRQQGSFSGAKKKRVDILTPRRLLPTPMLPSGVIPASNKEKHYDSTTKNHSQRQHQDKEQQGPSRQPMRSHDLLQLMFGFQPQAGLQGMPLRRVAPNSPPASAGKAAPQMMRSLVPSVPLDRSAGSGSGSGQGRSSERGFPRQRSALSHAIRRSFDGERIESDLFL